MTGRERLLAVLKGKPVDTVPCVPNMPEQFVDAFPGIKGENSLERAFNWIRQVGGDIINRRALPYEVKVSSCRDKDYREQEGKDSKKGIQDTGRVSF